MNNKNFWIACLSGAGLSLLFSNLPYLGFVNCLLCGAFWGSSIFAVWLYRRLGGNPDTRQAIRLGAMTGLVAGVTGFALGFIGLAGAQGFINSAGQFLSADATKGMQDIPVWAELIFNFIGVLLEIGFGALGGWIGSVIFNPRRQTVTA